MQHTLRRIVVVSAVLASTALAACTNPIAPDSPSKLKAPAERPNTAGAYQGAVG